MARPRPRLRPRPRPRLPTPTPARAPRELIEDAISEILLRVPPDEPADLVRASLVNKRWRRILTDPNFARRYREFHRTPPLLGFFHNHPPADVGLMPRFVATTGASPLPPPEFDGERWCAISGHHGRVLVDVGDTGQGLVVWDPLIGDRHRIHLPYSLRGTLLSPTVLCAVRGCSHLNCHGGPFIVVGVGIADGVIRVFVYSSETRAWTQPASVHSGGVNYLDAQKGILIGDEIYFTLAWGDGILKYDVCNNRLSLFDPPEVYDRGASLVQMEDGSLGLVGSKGSTIYLWSRKRTRKGAAGWVKRRVMDFEKLLPSSKLFETADVIGFAETVGLMFVGTFVGVYTIELKSGKMKRIGVHGVFYPIVPFTSFCTPDITVPHQNPGISDSKHATVLLSKNIITEILLRVPPDEPVDLIRASMVHKHWRRIITDPVFLQRYRDFHRRPPLLGFFHNHPPTDIGSMPLFVATTTASPLPELDFYDEEWRFMDCHHGRVLIDSEDSGLFVWDPITNNRHSIHRPVSLCDTLYSPTVLCAVRGCNHLNCHSDPFLVVGVGFADRIIQVFLYSSEARAWTQPANINSRGVNYMGAQKGTVIGDEIYFTLGWCDGILKYEVDRNCLSVFHPPEVYDRGASLVQVEDGSLGLAGSKGSTIYLWSRKEICEGAVGWVICRVLDFEKLLPTSKLFETAEVIGFAEGIGLMFVGTFAGVYTIELKSGKMKRIGEPGVFYPIVPFTSFYTPDFATCKLPWHAPSRDKLTIAESEHAW